MADPKEDLSATEAGATADAGPSSLTEAAIRDELADGAGPLTDASDMTNPDPDASIADPDMAGEVDTTEDDIETTGVADDAHSPALETSVDGELPPGDGGSHPEGSDATGGDDHGGVDDTERVDPAEPSHDETATSASAPAPPPPAPAPPPPAPAASSMPAIDEPEPEAPMDWYILKVAFNREDSIADALRKKVKMEGMDDDFEQIFVPTEDVATFTREGKRRISKRKLLPGYIMVRMRINDDTWFLVRETGGISDFTGAAGKPMPMEPEDVERFINKPEPEEDEEEPTIKIGIPFKVGDRVRVKEGNFENQEGDVDSVNETNGDITVIINIFGRSVPMDLKHYQVEPL